MTYRIPVDPHQYTDEYDQRLMSISEGEKQQAEDMYRRNLEAAQAQVAQQTNEAMRGVAGATAGPSPSMLRAGTYQTEQLGAQGRNEQQLEAAMAQQAYAAGLGDVYARQGQYGESALGAANEAERIKQQREALEAERKARDEVRKQQQIAQGVGVAIGGVGKMMSVI